MADGVGERLTGVRTAYDDIPGPLHSWIEDQLGGQVSTTIPRTGGMSPAVAATVVVADGGRAFVKAVSSDINPDTPTHFRHEIDVLSRIGPAPYRADLLGTYDDGHWVAMLLEDIDGDHPDWDDESQIEAVFTAVRQQADELTPMPDGLDTVSVAEILEKHQRMLLADPPAQLFARLPAWARQDYADLTAMVRDGRPVHGDTLCHWDVRHDNLLVRRTDHQVVLLDWGMARQGPWWGDVLVLGLEWADTGRFDDLLDRAGLDESEQHDATRVLASVGMFLTMSSGLPPPPGLPHLPTFRADLGNRCLAGVRRRW
ncbi:MAG TPA: aminoglycoside phosphotransferase family protein [Nocardioidaceae bacterium]|jgi:hypothetical protein